MMSWHTHHRSPGIPTQFPLVTNTLTVNGVAQSTKRPLQALGLYNAGRYPAEVFNINNAARNLVEIIANEARSDTGGDYRIRIYTIGMGDLVNLHLGTMPEPSSDILKRMANDPTSPDFNSAQLDGRVLPRARRRPTSPRRSRASRTRFSASASNSRAAACGDRLTGGRPRGVSPSSTQPRSHEGHEVARRTSLYGALLRALRAFVVCHSIALYTLFHFVTGMHGRNFGAGYGCAIRNASGGRCRGIHGVVQQPLSNCRRSSCLPTPRRVAQPLPLHHSSLRFREKRGPH